MRARALKAAAAAAEALSDPQPIPPPSSEEGGKKRKKKVEDADDTGAAKTTPSVAVPAASPVTLGVEKALKMINGAPRPLLARRPSPALARLAPAPRPPSPSLFAPTL